MSLEDLIIELEKHRTKQGGEIPVRMMEKQPPGEMPKPPLEIEGMRIVTPRIGTRYVLLERE